MNAVSLMSRYFIILYKSEYGLAIPLDYCSGGFFYFSGFWMKINTFNLTVRMVLAG